MTFHDVEKMERHMEYEIDYSHMPDYALITTTGKARVEGFTDLLKELTDSPLWHKGSKQLVDHRALELSHLSPEDIHMIQNIVCLFADRLGNGRCAFVMEGISDFLTGEFYVSSASIPHNGARSFSEMTPALFWLLLDD